MFTAMLEGEEASVPPRPADTKRNRADRLTPAPAGGCCVSRRHPALSWVDAHGPAVSCGLWSLLAAPSGFPHGALGSPTSRLGTGFL